MKCIIKLKYHGQALQHTHSPTLECSNNKRSTTQIFIADMAGDKIVGNQK